jgi:hypothetical protein
MRASASWLLLLAAAAVTAGGGSSATAAPRAEGTANATSPSLVATAVPTLGRVWAPAQAGYGQVKPAKINNGGDPTGLVWHVRWDHWGMRRAVGRGVAYFAWPGLGVADGTVAAPAVVVAYDLGSCRGKLAYRKIEWFFPKYGGTFIPEDYTNICAGGAGPGLPYRNCGGDAVRSPAGQARRIEASGLTCQRARTLVANSPSVRYLHRGGRFRYAGFFCGSEGDHGAVGPTVSFECARGRIDILWELRRK